MRPVAKIAAVVLALMCVGGALRLCLGWEVVINGWRVPAWVGVIRTLALAVLAVLLWWESRRV